MDLCELKLMVSCEVNRRRVSFFLQFCITLDVPNGVDVAAVD